jgi:phage gp36-like protein
MTYAVQQDLIDRFGQSEILELTDRANTGSIDATVVARALGDADALINSYIAAQIVLPLTSVPTNLVRLAADVARFYLSDDRPTDAVKAAYKNAVDYLRDVASGRATLGVDAASQPPPRTGGVQIVAANRVFTLGRARTPGTLDDY